MRTAVLLLLSGLLLQDPAKQPADQDQSDLNGMLMESTFKISGPKASDSKQTAVGTAFLMGRPEPNQKNRFHYVLVTAAHVLHDIQGAKARLLIRTKDSNGEYRRMEIDLVIRDGFRSLWTQHPTEDVAAMYVGLPTNVASKPIPTEFLAVEDDFKKYTFSVGYEVLTIGYPNGAEANSIGFGILRSGRIASHPLIPVTKMRGFLVDFAVFGGNSGGPVFVHQGGSALGGVIKVGVLFRVLGLVTNQMTMTATGERLSVASVVHAAFINETINLLPANTNR
ncbi:MAG: serine protease [Cyanobacteria bacterium]|nr:serine protease [Cyanobacteriota bacterium]